MQSWLLKTYLLLTLMLAVASYTHGQVRVKRGRLMKEERVHKARKERKAPEKPPHEVSTEVIPIRKSKDREELDAGFYVAWRGNDGLDYDDFLNNRNLHEKFIPARDTDLINRVYDDYRIFYRRLNERIAAQSAAGDTFWQKKIEAWLSEKPDSLSQSPIVASLTDSGLIFSVSIDSPAASTIQLSPVVYPIKPGLWYYNIAAIFSKYDSWMMVKSDDILQHEQIHFDIFELHARKMRKKLQELLLQDYKQGTADSMSKDMSLAFDQIYRQLDDMQYLFDKQTGAITAENGSLLRTNERWSKMLKSQLDVLDEYRQTEGYIKLQ